jgi:hypothetical protein
MTEIEWLILQIQGETDQEKALREIGINDRK